MAPSIKQWKSNLKGLDSLQQAEAPMPAPGHGEVLVEIYAVSLNYRDTEVVMGEYTHHKATQGVETVIVPCSDMSGVVTEVGEGVTAWKVGDRVLSTFLPDHQTGQVTEKELARGLGLPLDGVLATHRVFAEQALVRAPGYMTHEEGSTLPIASVTAWMSINGMRPMGQNGGEGEYVLLLGTGGVSIAGLQIAKASGAKVIITSSSDEKLEQAKKLGADYTINYRTNPNWSEEVMRVTNNHGADIILETGGSETLSKTFDCVAFGGLIDCIGYTSGKQQNPNDTLNMNVLTLRKNLTIKGIINGPKDRFEEMVQFYEKHQIHPVVNRVFPFEKAKEAFKFLASGAHFGKVVIMVKDQ
ncbi:zinc-type alcohol dehydrogenase-like protein C1773.06c [Aspergillus lentulus]|uniref:Zinc-type alcohol dehydrogenase-like protein C1773.06c n=1 Tax=Aspergillus lentulus TaxID=293939 RepID=A0ABQ0ZWW5_ASPLE|nr:zinc-type alcohol dehydrogenase-like protein C1773.06c [Aspergillus lentulus]GFF29989.1 zinc-type alcohol dehydrogenase-like protein C1773.06c [Aspergillus lentulus]GFF58980.1 zinc-type alcohol dehydrogenase-like protein C1773.06c [Aspergillus lentulus]GFF63859.1 zinc-type alcohol dehydrogenase-like protein C1773.06c [Aspergillus lentulus]GFF67633.1 zinc-type alcohol dehydrogenase-like protein C1773.06c [Aspergillus lentulus]GFF99228.1 zinc-type alcohol dehydrogenase-like protein C1773.06c 